MFQLINVTGNDALSFLQGQLTQDVQKLSGVGSLPAAWCNPKGRVICTLRMLDASDGIGLVIPGGLAEPVVKRMAMYRIRAQVDFEIAGSEWDCCAVTAKDDLNALAALDLLPADDRHASRSAPGIVAVNTGATPTCVEVYGSAAAFDEIGLQLHRPLSSAGWQAALIDAGVPTIVAATSEKFTPHMLNLDLLGAVNFNKGCYTGQEIVARTQHRGQSKRRLSRYRVIGGTAAVGDKLVFEGREVGDVVNVIGEDLLAVVPVAVRLQTLTVGGNAAAPVDLPYPLPG